MSLELQPGVNFRRLTAADIFRLPVPPDIPEQVTPHDARVTPGTFYIPASDMAPKPIPVRLTGLQTAWNTGAMDPVNMLQVTIQRSVDTLRWAMCDDIPKLLADIGFNASKPCTCSVKGRVNGEDELKKCPCKSTALKSPPSTVGEAELRHADKILAGMVQMFVKTHHTLAFLRAYQFNVKGRRRVRPTDLAPVQSSSSILQGMPEERKTPCTSKLAEKLLAEKAAKEKQLKDVASARPPAGSLDMDSDLQELFRLLDGANTPLENLATDELDDQLLDRFVDEILAPLMVHPNTDTSLISGDSSSDMLSESTEKVSGSSSVDQPAAPEPQVTKPALSGMKSTGSVRDAQKAVESDKVCNDLPAVSKAVGPSGICSTTKISPASRGQTEVASSIPDRRRCVKEYQPDRQDQNDTVVIDVIDLTSDDDDGLISFASNSSLLNSSAVSSRSAASTSVVSRRLSFASCSDSSQQRARSSAVIGKHHRASVGSAAKKNVEPEEPSTDDEESSLALRGRGRARPLDSDSDDDKIVISDDEEEDDDGSVSSRQPAKRVTAQSGSGRVPRKAIVRPPEKRPRTVSPASSVTSGLSRGRKSKRSRVQDNSTAEPDEPRNSSQSIKTRLRGNYGGGDREASPVTVVSSDTDEGPSTRHSLRATRNVGKSSEPLSSRTRSRMSVARSLKPNDYRRRMR